MAKHVVVVVVVVFVVSHDCVTDFGHFVARSILTMRALKGDQIIDYLR